MNLEDKEKILHFGVVLFEQMWLMRNKIRIGGEIPNWDAFSNSVNRIRKQYWAAVVKRKAHRWKIDKPLAWNPPSLGNYKFNFDTSLFDNWVVSIIVLRNHFGSILGVWINRFFSCNSFCAGWKQLSKLLI